MFQVHSATTTTVTQHVAVTKLSWVSRVAIQIVIIYLIVLRL